MDDIFNFESSFNSSFENVNSGVEDLFKEMQRQGFRLSEKMKLLVSFSLRELLNNAVEYGNKMDANKRVHYKMKFSKNLFEVSVLDSGEGFDLDSVIKKEQKYSMTRSRSRGIIALADMGFALESKKGNVTAKIYLDDKDILEKRRDKMEIRIENEIAYCLISTGLVAANVKELIESMKNKLDESKDYKALVIDLSKTEHVDSMGITFLIGVYKTVTAKGKSIKLKGASDAMWELFKIMKLDEIFEQEK